jgi:hypothetical protein
VTAGDLPAARFVASIPTIRPGSWNGVRGVCWDPVNLVIVASGALELWARQDETAAALSVVAEYHVAERIDANELRRASALINLAAIRASASGADPRASGEYAMAALVMRERRTEVGRVYGETAVGAVRGVAETSLDDYSQSLTRALAAGAWDAVSMSAGIACTALATDLPADARSVLVAPFAEVMPWLG